MDDHFTGNADMEYPTIFPTYIELVDNNYYTIMSLKSPDLDELEANIDKLRLNLLSINPSNGAMLLLESNKHLIDWDMLSLNQNPIAIKLLKSNLKKVNWSNLSMNQSPSAIELLEMYPENIVWWALSMNALAIHLLKENPLKVDMNLLLTQNANAGMF